jgi:integrase
VHAQLRIGRDFLREATGPAAVVPWDRVGALMVNEYAVARSEGYAPASIEHVVAALRSLLRWAFLTGRVARLQAEGVFSPRHRQTRRLRPLDPAGLKRMKAAYDDATVLGRRNTALVVLISRLGLRAGEVAGLRLDDIDWRAGRITVRSKGGQDLTLPLPVDVGEALVAYLHLRPPDTGHREVFLRVKIPIQPLTMIGVTAAIASTARRAGLEPVHAHRLRHAAATAVLAGGGTLIEARELLGHRATTSTMTYAHAETTMLEPLLVPWARVPG